MGKACIVLLVLGQLGSPPGGMCQGCLPMRFDVRGGVGWGEESGDEVLFGAQVVPPGTRMYQGLPGAGGVAGGGTHIPLFHAGTGTVGDPQQ